MIDMWDWDAECVRALDLTLLGNGFLELRVPKYMLPRKYRKVDEVAFVGVHSKTKVQLDKESEKASEEWKHCRYRSHLHPDNWGMSQVESYGTYADMRDDIYEDSDDGLD
jgi:hypothetical protein